MARVVRPGGLLTAYMWDVPGGGVPVLMSARPLNSGASDRDVMQRFWREARLETIETRVIYIPTVYSVRGLL